MKISREGSPILESWEAKKLRDAIRDYCKKNNIKWEELRIGEQLKIREELIYENFIKEGKKI